jgi:hypothetical protein
MRREVISIEAIEVSRVASLLTPGLLFNLE